MSYILLKVYVGDANDISCPPVLRTYIRHILNIPAVNDRTLAVTEQYVRLHQKVLTHKAAILRAMDGEPGYTQFTLKGPARA